MSSAPPSTTWPRSTPPTKAAYTPPKSSYPPDNPHHRYYDHDLYVTTRALTALVALSGGELIGPYKVLTENYGDSVMHLRIEVNENLDGQGPERNYRAEVVDYACYSLAEYPKAVMRWHADPTPPLPSEYLCNAGIFGSDMVIRLPRALCELAETPA